MGVFGQWPLKPLCSPRGEDTESYSRPPTPARLAPPRRPGSGRMNKPHCPCWSLLSVEQVVCIQRNKVVPCLDLPPDNMLPSLSESWKQQLCREFGKLYFVKLMGFVAEERKYHKVYPPPEQMFTWTQMCDIRDVKELSTDIDGFVHPGHGDLSGWARQGVLLLNAVLTVRTHQANSHEERDWEQFTDAVVSWLNQNLTGLVFPLWGSYAQKKGSASDRKRHHVLQTAYPSPLSVYRGFFGCRHFSKTNELLQKSGKKPINWKELCGAGLSPAVLLRYRHRNTGQFRSHWKRPCS
ncbi:uracil-DNA glycosylase [Sigmodon hispidus]